MINKNLIDHRLLVLVILVVFLVLALRFGGNTFDNAAVNFIVNVLSGWAVIYFFESR